MLASGPMNELPAAPAPVSARPPHEIMRPVTRSAVEGMRRELARIVWIVLRGGDGTVFGAIWAQ